MAQTLDIYKPGGMGNEKLKFVTGRVTNTGAETTYTVTAAALGLHFIHALICVDEGGASAVQHNPTRDSATNLITQVALTFTGGRELTFLAVGE